MDIATLTEHAERARRLAQQADPITQRRLLKLAAEYDARIAELKRSLKSGSSPMHPAAP